MLKTHGSLSNNITVCTWQRLLSWLPRPTLFLLFRELFFTWACTRSYSNLPVYNPPRRAPTVQMFLRARTNGDRVPIPIPYQQHNRVVSRPRTFTNVTDTCLLQSLNVPIVAFSSGFLIVSSSNSRQRSILAYRRLLGF